MVNFLPENLKKRLHAHGDQFPSKGFWAECFFWMGTGTKPKNNSNSFYASYFATIVKPARQHFSPLPRKTSVALARLPVLNNGVWWPWIAELSWPAHTSFFVRRSIRPIFVIRVLRGHYQFNGPINRAWRIQSPVLKTIRLVFDYWAKSSGFLLDI